MFHLYLIINLVWRLLNWLIKITDKKSTISNYPKYVRPISNRTYVALHAIASQIKSGEQLISKMGS